MPEREQVLNGIRKVATSLQRAPSRSEFIGMTGISEYHVLAHFPNWREAIRAAGLIPDTKNIRLDDAALMADWARLVRELREIPTRQYYRSYGEFSPGAFEKHFGPWSAIPNRFRAFADGKPEWADVVTLLPAAPTVNPTLLSESNEPIDLSDDLFDRRYHEKLGGRPTYGNPIDFRGLRHEAGKRTRRGLFIRYARKGIRLCR